MYCTSLDGKRDNGISKYKQPAVFTQQSFVLLSLVTSNNNVLILCVYCKFAEELVAQYISIHPLWPSTERGARNVLINGQWQPLYHTFLQQTACGSSVKGWDGTRVFTWDSKLMNSGLGSNGT